MYARTRALWTSDINLRTGKKGIALMLARAGDFNTLRAEMRPPGRIWTICQAYLIVRHADGFLSLCMSPVVALSASACRGRFLAAKLSGGAQAWLVVH